MFRAILTPLSLATLAAALLLGGCGGSPCGIAATPAYCVAAPIPWYLQAGPGGGGTSDAGPSHGGFGGGGHGR